MKDGYAHFDSRLERLDARKAALREGHRVDVDENGLMKLIPTGARRRQIGRLMPVRAFMIMNAVLLGFKAFLLYNLGFADYAAKVTELEAGATMDQVGAWLMQIEPVTLWLHKMIVMVVG